MLILNRRLREQIIINNDITITVINIIGDQVRIGIEAPKEIPVYRKEIQLIIDHKKSLAEAANTTKPAHP